MEFHRKRCSLFSHGNMETMKIHKSENKFSIPSFSLVGAPFLPTLFYNIASSLSIIIFPSSSSDPNTSIMSVLSSYPIFER